MDLEDICSKSKHFVSQHNDLSAWKNRGKWLEQFESVRMLKDATEINFAKLPLTEGKIHFIRKVKVDGKINVLNEDFEVGGEFIGEYTWATVCLKKQKIEVYYRAQDQDTAELVKEFDYRLNEEIKPIRQDIWKT